MIGNALGFVAMLFCGALNRLDEVCADLGGED